MLECLAITVHVPRELRADCGGKARIAISAANVREALNVLEQRHPALYRGICDETGAVRRHVNLFVNTAHLRDRQGLDTPLQAGDDLVIIPAVSGG